MLQGDRRARGRGRTRIALRGACVALLGVLTGGTSTASADLPRTYDVARYDSPFPAAVGQYPLGLSNAGDLDGDGKEDFITSQIVRTRNDQGVISDAGNGAIYIHSGANGQRFRTIEAPDPGGASNRANFAFPWVSKVGHNRKAPAAFTDLGSCTSPPANTGELCMSATVGPPDGVPDILVGARGVDAGGKVDSGRVYVYDGATFAMLKRIDQPPQDVTPIALARAGGTWFGRTVLAPSGRPPCAGHQGIGECAKPAPDQDYPASVVMGDMDGGGRPDLVIGASSTSETAATAHPGSHCAQTPGAVCQASGRVYIYSGESIAGTSPTEIYDGIVPAGGTPEGIKTIKNIHSQADPISDPINSDPELFGNALQPVGDVGECKPTTGANPVQPPPPGELCPRDNAIATPDGRPEFLILSPRTDLPVDDPDPNLADSGTAYLVDGKTSTILAVYRNPDPQLAATFGQIVNAHAVGDLGDTALFDVFIGSGAQNIPGVTGAGRGYVLNGNFKTGVGGVVLARLDDPTPKIAGGFGRAVTGAGDLVPGAASPANEIIVGGGSSRTGIVGDIHVFNPATEKVLQTIADPDNQGASSFGGEIIPMGDLNGDGFLDIAVAAPLYDSPTLTDTGRVYVFTSNNTPAPAPPAPPAPPAAVAPPPAAAPPAAPPPPPAAELLPGRCANDMRGTNGGDNLLGTIAGDAVFALAGDDVIEGLAGHDCIDAGADADDVSGHAGNDTILGGAGVDELDGGSGADRVYGQAGNDELVGASGNDMLAGGDGNDLVNGGSGKNKLFGERGGDRLIAGSSGGSTVDGGSGNDRVDALNGRRDSVRCGTGFDRAVLDRRDRASGCERVTRKRV